MLINKNLELLEHYIEGHAYKGYDPYDILNSPFKLLKSKRYIAAVAIQISKRVPFNIRPLLGIKCSYNPKALGLILKTYSLLFLKEQKRITKENADKIFKLIGDCKTDGYSGACWGYNFDWATPGSFLPAYSPSVVVTAFIVDGLYQYYSVFRDEDAKRMIISSAEYVLKDLKPRSSTFGLYIPYTEASSGICYNASLLGAEILIRAYALTGNKEYRNLVVDITETVLGRQKPDGHWKYSVDSETGIERDQVDFHQGFVLVSLYNILKFSGIQHWPTLTDALQRGLQFYFTHQFDSSGQAYYRLPRKLPADIHHQAQGIITGALMSEYNSTSLQFANRIADWTVKNMQDKKGFFYYRYYGLFKNRISYMRWAQAWMFLALTILRNENDETN